MAGRSRAHRGKQEGGSLWHEALLVGSGGSIDRRCRAGGVRQGEPRTWRRALPDVSCPAAVKDTLLLQEPKPSAHAAHALTHLTTPA